MMLFVPCVLRVVLLCVVVYVSVCVCCVVIRGLFVA